MAVAYSSYASHIKTYRNQSIVNLSPGQLILKAYDILLVALANRESARACKVLAELIESLDFKYGDLPIGLFNLYRYCMEEIKKGEYEIPSKILRDLRDTWAQALAQATSSE